MHKLYFFLFLLFAVVRSGAQQKKIYYDKSWQETGEGNAAFYRIATFQDSMFEVEDHYIDGPLYMRGYRTSLASNNVKYRVGPVVFYDHDGHKVREGAYSKGDANKWKRYYKGSDMLRMETCKIHDTSFTLEYDSVTHRVKHRSTHPAANLTLNWEYTGTDTIYSEVTKVVGDKDTSVSVTKFRDHSIIRKEYNNDRKKVVVACYDEKGAKVPCNGTEALFTYVEKMPVAQFSIQEYLSRNIVYPKKARNANVEGRVVVKFVVQEDGAVSDPIILHGIGHGCDEEALRVVAEMPYWHPGEQNGYQVAVYFTLPITFKLQ